MAAVYTTRERVMRAADIRASAYLAAEIDAAIESGARRVDQLVHRGDALRPAFAPWTGSITFDWPSNSTGNVGSSYNLWFAPHALLSLTSATSGGTAIGSNAYGWAPAGTSAPYPALAVNRSSASYLDPGNAAGQRSAVVTGVWSAAPLDERRNTSWTLGTPINASVDTVTLNAPFGVGQIVRIDDERIIVNDRSWSASGQTGSLAAGNADQALSVSNGAAFFAGEELLIDAERLYIRDIVGNVLYVQRGASGTVPSAHTAASIQWSRTASVERGALGTTTAAHTSGAQLYFYRAPAMIEQLNVAYALDMRQQEASAYARVAGSGDNERIVGGRAIKDLEKQVFAAYGRIRHRAV